MSRPKNKITLDQVDKARASFLCLLRDVKGRREKERHGQNLRRAISARAKWLRLKLAYEAQEFTPNKDKAQTAKAAPRAAGTPSGVIADGVPENFHGVLIHKGNTGRADALQFFGRPLVEALSLCHLMIAEGNPKAAPSLRRVIKRVEAEYRQL
jgi:hypothetical protein